MQMYCPLHFLIIFKVMEVSEFKEDLLYFEIKLTWHEAIMACTACILLSCDNLLRLHEHHHSLVFFLCNKKVPCLAFFSRFFFSLHQYWCRNAASKLQVRFPSPHALKIMWSITDAGSLLQWKSNLKLLAW